jgi:hypothetical protein
MADVILDPDVGFNAVRQRHPAVSEPREFNNTRQIRRTDSSEGFDFMFGEFEHAGGSSMLASSPPGLAERLAEEDPNTPPRSMLSLLDSPNGISGSSFSSSSSCDIQTSSLPLELDESDFECSLCYRLFYQPVTTSCGTSMVSIPLIYFSFRFSCGRGNFLAAETAAGAILHKARSIVRCQCSRCRRYLVIPFKN